MIIVNKELRRLNFMIIFGIFFMIFFLHKIIPFISILFIFIPYLLFLTKGVEIDFSKSRIRNFIGFLNFKKGQWKDINKYKNIVILVKNGKVNIQGTLLTADVELKDEFYELYLMTENHRQRFFVMSSNSKGDIMKVVTDMLTKTQLELKKYKPIRN